MSLIMLFFKKKSKALNGSFFFIGRPLKEADKLFKQ